MKEMSMKAVSNVMAGVGIAIVIGSFILNAAGLTYIAMTDALIAGGGERYSTGYNGYSTHASLHK